jgi:hypothetical protein
VPDVIKKGMKAYELFEGDQITVGITAEISVGRDKSWCKYEATTKLRSGERAEDARTRAIGHVNESVMEVVATTVETQRSYK